MTDASALTSRHLVVICLSAAGWAFGFGLGAPLASLWLRDAAPAASLPGLPAAAAALGLDTVIGLNTGIYYLGIALAAVLVPGAMRRWGRGCLVAGMTASGLTIAALPWSGSLAVWLLLRFGNGVAGAMSLIPLETIVNRHSRPDQRARNIGFYAFAIALGWALGNLVGLQMYGDTPRLALVLGGLVSVVGGTVLLTSRTWPAEPPAEPRQRSTIPFLPNVLSFGSAWSQGFLEGGMVAFLAVYLEFLGLAHTEVSWLTSGIMIGVILFQVPVAWLADRWGRTAVLIGCYLVTAAGLGFLPGCGAASNWLRLWLLLVGACSGAFYPLGLAILGERLPPARLARASAWYLAINCGGSLVGPVISGMAMDYWGKPAMFLVAEGAVLSVLVLWLALRPYTAGQHVQAGLAPVSSEEAVREAA
jgi:MFS family permease